MPAWLIPAGIQAGASVLGYLARRKRRTPEFGGTAHGKYLDRIRKQGMYSPTAKAGILGETSRRAGNIAHQERTNIRGYLESIGAGKSISGGKLLSSPGMERMRAVSGEAGRLETQNELSKVTAGEEFARRKTESQTQRRGERAEDLSGLVGGLAGAGASAYGAYRQKEVSDKLTREMGLPDTFGMSQEQANILRAHIMYGEREGKRFEIPPDIATYDLKMLYEWAKNNNIPYEDAESLWYDLRGASGTSNRMRGNFYNR